MTPVLIVGELNVDFILRGCDRLPSLGREIVVDDFQMVLGSSSAICAVGLARLGVPVRFVGLVGRDAHGDYCVGALGDASVDVSGVIRDASVSTGVTVALSSRADKALVTYPGSIGALTPAHLGAVRFDGQGHLHVSSYFLQKGMRPHWPEVFDVARAAAWTTSLDPGCDPLGCWDVDVRDLLRRVDVFLPNENELLTLTGRSNPIDGLRALDNGRTLTVVKLGARGAMALQDDGVVEAAPPRVDPIDTTGAGDSFDAGFLAAWLNGASLASALRSGVTCGALSTQGVGGTAAQPPRAELESWLSRAVT